MNIKTLNKMIEFYQIRNKTIFVELLIKKHYNELMKLNSLQLGNKIEDDLKFVASELLEKYTQKYNYSKIIKLYNKEYGLSISENTLFKLKTNHRRSNIKNNTVINIANLLKKII